jgi:DNA-binding LacI/PurR family transcriptional regulator
VKRPTIADIARRAGVSKGAVSYALNGQPGVSAQTRERIVAIAAELGWTANSAARALSDGRAHAFGLVVDRPARTLGVEPFFVQLISGIEAELSTGGVALLLLLTEDTGAEMAAYRTWWAGRRVDGVFLVDQRVDDPRLPLVRELRLPAVVVGSGEAEGLPCVWNDERVAVDEVVEYLAALGHRRIARVAGPPRLVHTRLRTAAFDAACARLGVRGEVVTTDYTGERGAAATRRLLSAPEPDRPSAIVFDNDVMAVAAVGVAQELGLSIPADLSLVAWDDSALCQLVHPQLSAVGRDIAGFGARAARLLRDVAAGGEGTAVQADPPRLSPRGSTGQYHP